MTYIGVGADLKPVNIYTERPTHTSSTTYHAKNLESQCLSLTNLKPKSLKHDPNNLKHKNLNIQSLKHANNNMKTKQSPNLYGCKMKDLQHNTEDLKN